MFTFKLQSVLNYRQSIEERKQLAFAEGQKALEKETALLAGIRGEKDLFLTQLKEMQSSIFNAADVSLYLSYYDLCKEKEALQIKTVERVSAEVEELRKALLEAVQNRKAMDNLNEKQRLAYEEKMAGIERRSGDETAVLRFIRQKK